jgi:colicin import membrane protein
MAIAQAIRYNRWEHPEPGTKKSFLLSLAAHSLLALMFMVGLNWKTSSTPAGVEVELWDNSPQQVIEEEIIKEATTPVIDEKAEIVIEKKKVEPKPEPIKPEAKPVSTPKPIQNEKPKLEPKPKVELKPEPKEKPKVEPKPKVELKPEPKEKPKAKEDAKDKPKAPLVDAKQKAAEEKERADRIAKMQAQAGAETGGSGGTSGAGTGAGGIGSPGYADKVRRTIKPRIIYPNAGQVEGNPAAVVAVQLAPDGKIIQRKINKSSGLSDWDSAVLKAIDDAGSLPKDDDGTVPKAITLIFRPKD